MGTYTRWVYTKEQQDRLGVDEDGYPVASALQNLRLPPDWILGKIEWPKCKKDMGTYTVVTFCPEQQKRLGVDEKGNKTVALLI